MERRLTQNMRRGDWDGRKERRHLARDNHSQKTKRDGGEMRHTTEQGRAPSCDAGGELWPAGGRDWGKPRGTCLTCGASAGGALVGRRAPGVGRDAMAGARVVSTLTASPCHHLPSLMDRRQYVRRLSCIPREPCLRLHQTPSNPTKCTATIPG